MEPKKSSFTTSVKSVEESQVYRHRFRSGVDIVDKADDKCATNSSSEKGNPVINEANKDEWSVVKNTKPRTSKSNSKPSAPPESSETRSSNLKFQHHDSYRHEISVLNDKKREKSERIRNNFSAKNTPVTSHSNESSGFRRHGREHLSTIKNSEHTDTQNFDFNSKFQIRNNRFGTSSKTDFCKKLPDFRANINSRDVQNSTPFRNSKELEQQSHYNVRSTKDEPSGVSEFDKPKKKKKKTKEERRVNREKATLDNLYKPKDSRVQLVGSDLFKILKGETNVTKVHSASAPMAYAPMIPIETSTPASGINWKEFRFKASCSPIEFPSLDSGSSKTKKACVINLFPQEVQQSNSLPTVAEENNERSTLSSMQSSWPVISDLFQTSTNANDSATLTEEISTSKATDSTLTPTKQRLSIKPLVVSLDVLLETSKVKGSKILGKQIAKKRNDRSSAVKRENHKLTIGNLLDSSGPAVIQRGKIKNKPKKPSKLKKAILKSRELRKSCLLTELILPEENIEDTIIKQEDDESRTEIQNECDNNDKESRPESKELKNSTALDKPGLNKMVFETKSSPDKIGIKLEDNDRNIFKEMLDTVEEESKPPPDIGQRIVDLVKLQMHSRKFRPYCDMFVSKEMHGLVVPLMKELHRLQDRLYKTDPIKFKTKRRYVNGLKDVVGVLKFNKAQLVILAPDIEPNKEQGGLDDKVLEIISLAKEKCVPYIFSGNRYILGKCIMQMKSPVSAIAIIDKQSVEDSFNRVTEEAEILRAQYQSVFNQKIIEAMVNGA